MRLIDIHENNLVAFCEKNGYSFEKLRKMPRCGNESVLFVQRCSEKKTGKGLEENEPAEILLTMTIDSEGNINFVKGKNIDKYLK